jgi:formylmethanofuran dehydrogenase subunit E
MVNLPDELKALKRFHGHLGPYVVVGYRMGVLARERLEGKLKAVCFCGSKTPLSCIIDGVQFSSSCTMGKGNISVLEAGDAKVQFMNDKHLLEVSLLAEVWERINATMSHETEELISLQLYNEEDSELFRFTVIERTPQSTRVKLK